MARGKSYSGDMSEQSVRSLDMAGTTKRVGRVKTAETAEESFWRAHKLEKELNLLNPYPRPRGFIHKAKTYAEYEQWRRAQPNPRLW
jgi:hypothetical protein